MTTRKGIAVAVSPKWRSDDESDGPCPRPGVHLPRFRLHVVLVIVVHTNHVRVAKVVHPLQVVAHHVAIDVVVHAVHASHTVHIATHVSSHVAGHIAVHHVAHGVVHVVAHHAVHSASVHSTRHAVHHVHVLHMAHGHPAHSVGHAGHAHRHAAGHPVDTVHASHAVHSAHAVHPGHTIHTVHADHRVHASHAVHAHVVELADRCHLVAVKLALNALAIGCVADGWEQGSDALDQLSTLDGVGKVQRRLDNIVGIGIPQKLVQARLVDHLLDEELAGVSFSHTNALQG